MRRIIGHLPHVRWSENAHAGCTSATTGAASKTCSRINRRAPPRTTCDLLTIEEQGKCHWRRTTGGGLLDADSLSADPRAHRATRGAPHVIAVPTPGAAAMRSSE